jgi:hypothetical protein
MGDCSYLMDFRKKIILTKDDGMYFEMIISDALCEPTIPYDHITPKWEGAWSVVCLL